MNEFLAYRFPNQDVKKMSGTWGDINSQDIDLNSTYFVLTDFDASSFSVFQPKSDLKVIPIPTLGKSTQISISQETYLKELEGAMQEMQKQDVEKMIFSRIKTINSKSIDYNFVFEQLLERYPDAFVYFLYAEKWGCWMGASPEILLEENLVSNFKTVALAGTLPVGNETWSEKEKVEQHYVSDYIEEIIGRNGKLITKSLPIEKNAGPVKHLQTTFNFELKKEAVLTFIKEIHPTPAVCGVPLDKAKSFIHQIEKHERSLYTGFLGNLGGQKTTLYVNLRCMQCFDETLDLYVGGGITNDSIPAKEWEETERKADTLMQAIRYKNEANNR
jgi:isochorismate synthase